MADRMGRRSYFLRDCVGRSCSFQSATQMILSTLFDAPTNGPLNIDYMNVTVDSRAEE